LPGRSARLSAHDSSRSICTEPATAGFRPFITGNVASNLIGRLISVGVAVVGRHYAYLQSVPGPRQVRDVPLLQD
jgi:hypothetical protein